ncbi:MAG: rod shape-determining protein RodA [Actinobacteria bacterium]|nr:rod shape-determining protein RodA [Actinomycetota bacterium]
MKNNIKSFFIDDRSLALEEKKKSRSLKFDYLLPMAAILLSGFGLLIIYSATRYGMPESAADPMYYLKRQGYFLGGAVIAFILIQLINYRILLKVWWVFFLINIGALISVIFFGYEVHGSKSWIDFKYFSVQPSEFSKIFMVITVAALLSKWPREKIGNVGFKKVVLSLLAAIVSIVLVLMEPDYGTALIFFLTYMGMLFISGANFLYFLGISILSAGGFFSAIKIGLIKQYQLDRILVFIKPDIQKQTIGYNLFQSKLAIGSGGLWGKGLFLGKQTNLNYVPEHHTDFIFSVVGEEVGFFGAVAVIFIMAFIIWRCFYIASKSGNDFGALIAGGIGFIILSQAVINIGMTIGIMPIIGIPLPFLSAGGSNLLAIFLGIALVENVYLRRELRKSYEIAYEEFD